jgi:transcriptional regulator GlxA family with amidase domain
MNSKMPNLEKNRRQSLKLLLLGLFGMLTNKGGSRPSLSQVKGSTYLNPIVWDPNEKMKIAYILFDGITLLDFIGIYDPISRIKSKGFMENLSWDLCATAESIQDSFGLKVAIDKIKPDLSNYHMVIIPGGFGTRPLQFDKEFMEWLKTAKEVEYKVSVCTGSLLLGSAGFLNGKIATTNFNEYETLNKYCKKVSKNRIVDDQNVITAGAVASSLDLGLYICEKLIDKDNTEVIRKSMDYAPGKFEIVRNE